MSNSTDPPQLEFRLHQQGRSKDYLLHTVTLDTPHTHTLEHLFRIGLPLAELGLNQMTG